MLFSRSLTTAFMSTSSSRYEPPRRSSPRCTVRHGSQGAGGYRFLARSPGFRDEWLAEAERLCTGFGERRPSTWSNLRYRDSGRIGDRVEVAYRATVDYLESADVTA